MIGKTNASAGGSGGENKLAKLVDKSIETVTEDDLYGITTIGTYAFAYCRQLNNVTIPASVTNIDTYAFQGCSSLSSITIPKSVNNVGDRAFDACNNLTNLIIEDGVSSIGSYSFHGCSIINLELPLSITNIARSGFAGNRQLTTLKLGSGTLQDYAFQNCVALVNIDFANVESIGYQAFSNCGAIETLKLNNVKTIGNRAFNNCYELSSVEISTSITNIEAQAFLNCSALKEITILADTPPPTLESTDAIPDNVEKIYVPYGSLQSYQEATNWSYFSEKFVEIELQPTSALVYTQDGDTYFTGTNNLWRATALDSTWTGGELIIPDTYNGLPVTRIGRGSFMDIQNITDVVILGENLTIIDQRAFLQSSITSIKIPKSVTTINDIAFSSCANLKTMKVLAETPPTLSYELPSNVETIYIPTGTLSAYESATNWSASVGKFVEI